MPSPAAQTVAQTVAAVPTSATSTRTRPVSRRLATIVSMVAVPAAVAVSGLVVAQSSYSAYSATTTSPTSNWATGTVALSDDDANAAAFSVSNARPGATGTRCLVVTSTGSLPSQVKVYGANGSGTTSLAAYLTLTITQGTGGSFGSCNGFTPLASGAELFRGNLVTFGTTYTGYANGLGGWAPSGQGAEARTYRISYAISPDAPNDTQGGTAAGDIVFEAQNS